MDINKLVKLPESKTLEFKRDTSSLEPILKSIIAFANTAGGILLIGVDDDGTIVGVKEPKAIQEQLINSIAHRITPQILPDFSVVAVQKKAIVVIEVDYMPAPFFLANKGERRSVYLRFGNSNRLASEEMIAEMKRANHYPFFDKAPCGNTSEKDLDKKLIRKTLPHRDGVLNTEKLLTLGLLINKGKKHIATNGGIILFGKPATRLAKFPFAEVRCARFAGTSRAEFIDRLEIDGGILAAINEVPKFIRRNTKMGGKFGQMRRRDIPEYPVEGIREALTNALVHANYEIPGTRIFVAIYEDRLEIQNPGIMPPGMSIEHFKAGVSRIRNPVIARIFGELELVEEWGSGYKRILDDCKKGGYKAPKWEELGTVLRVTFYPHAETMELSPYLGPSWDQAGGKSPLDLDHVKILELCHEPQAVTTLMEVMGWKNKTKFRQKFIHPLLEIGALSMTIQGKPNSPRQQYISTKKGKAFFRKRKNRDRK